MQLVSCVHNIPAVLLSALLVSGHSLFEQFEFYLWTDIKIKYLHLALTQIQYILGCTPYVDALQWFWVD